MSRYAILCPICQKVSTVKWVNELEIAFLACGHSRTTSLLPKVTGIGLEDILNGTAAARQAFPGTP
jgi:hypothetical protein